MGFLCPTNTNIKCCKKRATSSKWITAVWVTVSTHKFILLNKIPSFTKRENVLMQEIA